MGVDEAENIGFAGSVPMATAWAHSPTTLTTTLWSSLLPVSRRRSSRTISPRQLPEDVQLWKLLLHAIA